MKSYTVAADVVLEGRGLFSGENCRTTVRPAQAGSGLTFVRDGVRIPAVTGNLRSAPNCTLLESGGKNVAVTEHLLAALWTAGIDTAEIEVEGPELPNLDGSAQWQYELITQGGRTEYGERPELILDQSVTVGSPESFIIWTPGPGLHITLIFEHPELGYQVFAGEVDRDYAASDILPARSFVTDLEARQLIAAGALKNMNQQDALVITAGRPNSNLRFADEFVRHKVLDLLGDLYYIGAELSGRITAYRSGHSLNRELATVLAASRS